MTQTVATAGSGLVFVNTYAAGDSQQYVNCIVAAEQTLEGLCTNSVTINATFDTVNNGATGDLATNDWGSSVHVTYAQLESALASHEFSPYAVAAIDSLPSTDPNPAGGADWSLPTAYARMLGLTNNTPPADDTVTLNIGYDFSYGQDVINTLEHELSEGAMGRVGGLGDQNSAWSTMDLFRYSSPNVRDYTDGRDGLTTYFSYDGTDLSSPLSFNNRYNSSGVKVHGGDTADFTERDVFGTGGTGEINTLSQTDLEVMDSLGWDPSSTQLPAPNPVLSAGTTADMIMFNGNSGVYEIYDLGNNTVLSAYELANVGFWQFIGLGDFNGADTSDMILRNDNGKFELYDISNNVIANPVSLGSVGLNWSVAGFGDFDGASSLTEMMLRNSDTGAFELYQTNGNTLAGSSVAAVGNNFQVIGVGDFSGVGESQMMMQDFVGDLELYTYNSNTSSLEGIAVGKVGSNFKIVGVGDILGNGGSQMMMQDARGDFELYSYNSNTNALSGVAVGAVGTNWAVRGFGPLNTAGQDEMLLQNGSGVFEVYDYNAGTESLSGTSMGAVGAPWVVDGIAAAPLSSGGAIETSTAPAQLVQAMAAMSDGGIASTSASLSVATLSAAQSLLTATQHA